jgi:hypothetical protein
MIITTHHTYPDLLFTGGRLAATDWDSDNASRAVAATVRLDNDAVVLRVSINGKTSARGLMPAGLGWTTVGELIA